MRKVLLLLCVFGTPSLSLAQTSQPSWGDLKGLQAGQSIQVIDTNSKKHSGTFLSLSDTAISYMEVAAEHSIERQDVRSVKLMKNPHRVRNTIIGLGVGAGVGAGIGAATHKSCSSQSFCLDIGGRALPAAVGGVIGGVGGAVIGVLIPSHRTIYDVSPH
jgi:hypothetical protein